MQNGKHKPYLISYYTKHQGTKCSNEKADIDRRDFKKRRDPTINCLQGIYSGYQDTQRLKLKEWKEIYHANSN